MSVPATQDTRIYSQGHKYLDSYNLRVITSKIKWGIIGFLLNKVTTKYYYIKLSFYCLAANLSAVWDKQWHGNGFLSLLLLHPTPVSSKSHFREELQNSCPMGSQTNDFDFSFTHIRKACLYIKASPVYLMIPVPSALVDLFPCPVPVTWRTVKLTLACWFAFGFAFRKWDAELSWLQVTWLTWLLHTILLICPKTDLAAFHSRHMINKYKGKQLQLQPPYCILTLSPNTALSICYKLIIVSSVHRALLKKRTGFRCSWQPVIWCCGGSL